MRARCRVRAAATTAAAAAAAAAAWARALAVALALATLASAGSVVCPCALPSDQPCPANCRSCQVKYVSCACNLCGPCPSGYRVLSTCTFCCGNATRPGNSCMRDASVTTTACARCAPGHYGQNCVKCSECSGHGWCNDGMDSDGACHCYLGYAGATCQFSDDTTCLGRGSAQFDGSCRCNLGFAGRNCETCDSASGYLGTWPHCQFCVSASTCSGHGVCNHATATCVCGNGFDGSACSKCKADFYAYPTCLYCKAAVSCHGNGDCAPDGTCKCREGFTGASCDSCAPGHFGPACEPCPGGLRAPCGNKGVCIDGAKGNGTCVCRDGFYGKDCNQPHIQAVVPRAVDAEGGAWITLSGTNFGTFGRVEIGCDSRISGCQIDTFVSSSVRCRVQQLQMLTPTVPIVLVRSGDSYPSNALTLSVNPPKLSGVWPRSGPAAGDTVVTLVGSSLVAAVQVLANRVALQFSTPPAYGTVAVIMPPGVGTVSFVVLTAELGPSNALENVFSYDAPIVTGVSPLTGSPLGGVLLTVTGCNFGPELAPERIRVTVGGRLCPIRAGGFRMDSIVECTLPPGGGARLHVEMSVTGTNISVVSSTASFTYFPPQVASVSGCVDADGVTRECAHTGTVLTVIGESFGANSSLVSVAVGPYACSVWTLNDTFIKCAMYNLSIGWHLDLTVTVAKQSATLPMAVSFAGPVIFNGTLNWHDPPYASTPGALITASTSPTARVRFFGRFDGLTVANTVVVYGPARRGASEAVVDPSEGMYPCQVDPVSTSMLLVCRLAKGVGRNLVFQVFVDGVPSNIGADTLSYPAPTITPRSLRRVGEGGEGHVLGRTTRGERLLISGTNFAPQPGTIAVSASNGEATVPCLVAFNAPPSLLNDSSVACDLGSGDGDGYRFTIVVGPPNATSNQWKVTGQDLYEYPAAPLVESVHGCANDAYNPNATVHCPTDARHSVSGAPIRLTITGQRFQIGSTTVTVGFRTCGDVQHSAADPTVRFTCALPMGAGFSRVVTVTVDGVYVSRGAPLVSYAAPEIASVSGCVDDGNATGHCPRGGNVTIELRGSNLGASEAKVIVGGTNAETVVHDSATPHALVRFTLPMGVGVDKSVILVQNDGEMTRGNNIGLLSYEQCAPGTFSVGTETVCHDCEPGRFSNLQGQDRCLDCPAGSFADSNASSECTKCPAGSAANETRSTACAQCVAGSYMPLDGGVQCQPCLPGAYAPAAGATKCERCPAGSFQPAAGASACALCDPGRVSGGEAQVACDACPAGMFAPTMGLDQCLRCPNGTRSSASTGSVTCEPCQAGSVAGASGQGACTPCDPGRFAASQGLAECQPCASGSYAPSAGAIACVACEPGRFRSAEGGSECSLCPPGQHMPQPGQSACVQCPPGSYQDEQGGRDCKHCPPGSFMDSSGQVDCFLCAPGQFSAVPMQSACRKCAPGTVSSLGDHGGATGCVQCAPGRFSGEGSAHCESCPLGRVAPANGASACDWCLPGRVPAADGTRCVACPPGSFALARADAAAPVAQCTLCDAGTFAAAEASSSCDQCDPGRFASGRNATTCEPCDLGNFQREQGSVQCSVCPSGRFANVTGLAECEPCPVGSFAASAVLGAGATACRLCEVGRFQDHENSVDCVDCAPGRYAALRGASACVPCSLGRALGQSQATACADCAPGTVSGDEGRASCTPCPRGQFANASGLSACSYCPMGRAAGAERTVECEPCLADRGDLGAGVGAVECARCSSEEYAVASDARTGYGDYCVPCPSEAQCVGTRVLARQGFWLSSDSGGRWRSYKCLPGLCESGGQCAAGRRDAAENPLCGMCERGLYDWGGHCQACHGYVWRLLVILALLTVAVAFIHVMAQNAAGEMKIALNFTQVALLLANTDGSGSASRVFEALNVNLFSNAAGSGCVAPVSQGTRMLLALLPLPLGLTLLALLAAAARAVHASRRCARGGDEAQFDALPFKRSVVALYLCTYYAMSKAVFDYFNCDAVWWAGRELRLVHAYPQVECGQGLHRRVLPLFATVAAIQFGLIPAALLLALWRRARHHGARSLEAAAVEVLTGVFRVRMSFWEVLSASRRAALAAVIVFLDDDRAAKLATASCLCIVFLLAHVAAAPFASRVHNAVETAAWLYLALLATLLSALSEPYAGAAQALVAVLVMLPSSALLLWVVAVRGGAVHKALLAARERWALWSAEERAEFEGLELHGAASYRRLDDGEDGAKTGE